MSGNKNALVLMWTGNELPNELILAIKDVLVNNGVTIPEYLTAIYKDAEGVAKSLIREANGVSTYQIDITDSATAEAIKTAVEYIGERFKNSLAGAKGNLARFTLDLNRELQKAHAGFGYNPFNNNQEDRALVSAVKIIATTTAIIPTKFANKYHITKEVCEVIKLIHNQYA